MNLEKFGIITKRHFLEFLALLTFSFIVLNPLDLSLGLMYPETTPETVKSAVLSLGILAPIGMVILEALQVIIAPLPPITMVGSGYTFGLFQGSIYSFTGVVIGSSIALLVSRKFGRPVVKSIVGEKYMDSFQDKLGKHYYYVIAAMFATPGFPHDMLCYMAGLTDLELKKLLPVIAFARIPVIVGLVLTGSSVASSQIHITILVLGLFAVAGFFAARNQDKIISVGKKTRKLAGS